MHRAVNREPVPAATEHHRSVDPEVTKSVDESMKTTADSAAEIQRLISSNRLPKEVMLAVQKLEGQYRKALEDSVSENLHGRQREQLLREQLRLAEEGRKALQVEGSGVKTEWESMYKEVKDARQQHAASAITDLQIPGHVLLKCMLVSGREHHIHGSGAGCLRCWMRVTSSSRKRTRRGGCCTSTCEIPSAGAPRPHNIDYNPTRWARSPRVVIR